MGLLSWLFGSSSTPKKVVNTAEQKTVPLQITETAEFNIVGESHYQDALDEISGGRTEEGVRIECLAHVIPEDDNPHDQNAVRVEIERRVVGYMARPDAVIYREHLGIDVGVCTALIVGGWDRGEGNRGSFGVKLAIVWPPAVEERY